MNYIIKYLKTLAIPLISIIIMSILFSITNLIGFKTNNIFILIAMAIVMFISGYLISKEIQKKKYIHGLLFGIITSILYLLLSLIFHNELTFNTIIYYLVITISSMLGSMISSVKSK